MPFYTKKEILTFLGYVVEAPKAEHLQPIEKEVKDEPIKYESDDINKLIAKVRESDFDGAYVDPKSQRKILIKYHDNPSGKGLNPIHKDESHLQALHYLRGMLLINDTYSKYDADFKKLFSNAFRKYLRNRQHNPNATEELAEDFAKILASDLKVDIDKARKQLTMARDLGIMMEPNLPQICTISKSKDEKGNDKRVNIQLSTPIKIGDKVANDGGQTNYYDQHFTNLETQGWFKDARKSAGFKTSKNTWFDNFFKDNLDSLKTAGVPAPTSARWLPLPANNQKVEICTAEIDENGNLQKKTSSFIRMGITSAYNIKDVAEQKKLAKEQLKEIIRLNIKEQVEKYRSLYGYDSSKQIDFFVSYQTLLSPHRGEALAYDIFRDNNAKFIEMAKEAMTAVSDDPRFKTELERLVGGKVKIHFVHTNAAINSKSGWISAKEFSEDRQVRQIKMENVSNTLMNFSYLKEINFSNLEEDEKFQKDLTAVAAFIINNPKGPFKSDTINKNTHKTFIKSLEDAKTKIKSANIKPELKQEILTRMEAAFHLRQLLNNEEPYNQLEKYQRNIMMAALEHLAMGSQALALAGCKSARDRTAIFASAVKTMLEDPDAMKDWEKLSDGITKSLEEGHHFRSMVHHSGVVKVSDVHKNFMKGLDEKIQEAIKSLKKFSKKLGEPKKEKKKKIEEKKETSPEKEVVTDKKEKKNSHTKIFLALSPPGTKIKEIIKKNLPKVKENLAKVKEKLPKIKKFLPKNLLKERPRTEKSKSLSESESKSVEKARKNFEQKSQAADASFPHMRKR